MQALSYYQSEASQRARAASAVTYVLALSNDTMRTLSCYSPPTNDHLLMAHSGLPTVQKIW